MCYLSITGSGEKDNTRNQHEKQATHFVSCCPRGVRTVTEIEQKYKMFVTFIIHLLYPLTNVLLPVPDKSADPKLTPKILQTILN